MQQTWIRTLLASAIIAGGLGIQTAPSAAMPVLSAGTTSTDAAANIEKTWYRCGYYYRCHRRYYSYYRGYRPYYRGYYYRPHIGIGLGGIGLGFY